MEDFKLIAGIILGGDDRLYTRNDYIQFAYIGGEPPILIPDYHFKILQADGKLEGFGQDIGEQIDIINIDIEGEGTTYTFPQDSELYTCYVYLEATSPPLGSALTVNVYDTSRAGNPSILDTLLTIPAGQTKSLPNILTISNFSAGAVLQISVISVGSESPGAGVKLFLGRKYNEGETFDWERVGITNTGNGYAVVFKKQDEDKYIIRKNEGQDEVLTFLKQNFLYDSLPPYEYVGNYFWYWRIYGGFYKDIVNGSAPGNFSPWLEWAYECAAFVPISLGLSGSVFYPFHDQIKPTFKFMGYIANPLGLGIMVCSPGSSANDSATYSLGDETRPYTATLSGSYSSNANGAHNVSFSHSWQGDSLYAVQWGEKDSPNIEIYTLGGSGSGTASAVQTVDDSGGIGNEFVNSISETSSYTASGEIPENDNLVRKFSYDATHSRSYSGNENTGFQSISLTQEETGYRKEKTEKQYLLKMNNAAFAVEKTIETSYTVFYEGSYSSSFDYQLGQESYSDNITCTLTERLHNRRRPLSFVEVKNAKRIVTGSFYISLYNNGGVKSISGYFEDPFLLYKTIVTEREQNITRTRSGSTSNYSRTEVESYQYQSQDLVSSGVMCDIFRKENGVIKQWTSPVTISKSLTTNNDGEDIYSIDSVNFSLSSEYTENEFFPLLGNEGEYIIVPSSSYSEIAYFLIKQFKSSANLYVINDEQGNETIELAISEQKPSNNNFGGAVLLEGQDVSVRGNNYGADWQGTLSEPSLSPPTQSVWYKWVAPSSTPVTIHTLGSPVAADYQVDTVIAVYTGSSLDSLSLVASNDDASVELPPNGDYLSAVVINPTEGTTYYIQVDGYSDTQWSFVLSISTEGLNVPTPIQEETRRADIYRFDTQSLKWKRMPNARSVVSPLTAESDFVSYHATPQTEALDGAICPEE